MAPDRSPRHSIDGPAAARMRRAWWFGGTLILAVALAAAAVGWNDLRVRRAAGERYLEALVDSHARQVAQQVDSTERAFHGLANGLEVLGDASPEAAPVFAREQIARIVAGHPHVLGLRVDAFPPGFAPVEPGVRHRLQLGEPGPGAGQNWTIPLAMAFDFDARGVPRRWLHAELDVRSFLGILGAHEMGTQGVASLLTADGVLIARSDTGTRHARLDARRSPLFEIPASRDRGVVAAVSRLDGVARLVGYRRIEGRPLVATVGMTPDALYGGWGGFAAALALGILLLAAAWLSGMTLLVRAARRESRMRQDLASREHVVGRLRERVRDAEAQYRFLYEQHPLPAFVYDRVTMRLLEANAAAAHAFGYGREAMMQLGTGDLLAEGSVDDIRSEMLANPLSQGRRVWTMRRRDGSRFSAMVFSSDLASFAGRPARLVLALDVTDRERAAANLHLLRRAVEASEEGVFILGAARGTMVYGNAAFARLTGIDPDDHGPLRRAAVDAIVDPVTREIVRGAMVRAQDVHVDVEDRRDPGDVRSLEVRLTPVLDGDGSASHFVGIVNDVTLRKRAAEEMAFRASHDALTGLVNRDGLVRHIDGAIAKGARLAVCHLDLDRFQLVNDSLGHDVGDGLLVSVARRLEAAAGSRACVARLGGDEFGIVLAIDHGQAVETQVEALRGAVAGSLEIHGVDLHVTPSVGYSRHPGDGDDGQALLRAAVQAGAQAKRFGRNRSVGYRHGFDSRAGERLLLVQELHRALEREEFVLAFQLQLRADGRPSGLEALVRWNHPQRGVLGPGAFMDACEDSGLILPLGRWVLREAVHHWRLLDQRGWGSLRMGVNVSALQFQEGLVEDVRQLVDEAGLPAERLELELTESVLLARPAEARRAMEALNALGASLAIDDFGTGYSSLAYLKNLPLQRLKLDQSFIRDLGRDPDSEAICAAILRMAHGLSLGVIAEGVETPGQYEWLRARGCDEFQGYLFARPTAFGDVLERLGPPAASVPGHATGLA